MDDVDRMDKDLRTLEWKIENGYGDPDDLREEYQNLQMNYQDTIAREAGEDSPADTANIHNNEE